MAAKNKTGQNPSAPDNINKGTWDAGAIMRYMMAQQPDTIDPISESLENYKDMLSRKVYNIIRLENLPEHWNHDYILHGIFHYGFLVVADTPLGVLPLRTAIVGNDPFGFPQNYEIANHAFSENIRGSLYKGIHYVGGAPEQQAKGVLLYLQYYPPSRGFYTIDRLLNKYAIMLALADSGVTVNLINSKVAYIFECEDDAQAATAAAIYDAISRGEPAVFKRSKTPTLNSDGSVNWTINPVRNTYVADMILETKRNIMMEFYSEIGINNSPENKRERVNVEEVNSNNDQLTDSVYNWDRNLQQQVKWINELFGYNIKYSMPYIENLKSDREEQTNATTQSDRPNDNISRPI